MSFRTTDPAGAKELLDGEDTWTYLDVRSAEEFQAGHVPGAYNIPLAHRGPAGMEPNPGFLEAVRRHFPNDTRLVVGCAAGGRSARACQVLEGAGYTALVNMHGGFGGMRGPDGSVEQEGWEACGFPTTTDADAARTWSALG